MTASSLRLFGSRILVRHSYHKRCCRLYGSRAVKAPDPNSCDLQLNELQENVYAYNDRLTQDPAQLLRAAVRPYFSVRTKADLDPDRLDLGYQHAYFRPNLEPHQLCDDGTDTKFLPGPAEIWKYRLWAGGSVTLTKRLPVLYDAQLPAFLVERVSDTRTVGTNTEPSKVFVTIERKFAVTPEGRADKLIATEILDPSSTLPFMIEKENICFLRDVPTSLRDERRIRAPSDPLFSHTIIPRKGLLFQFSALTYNAHSIHIDREFAQQQYEAKDLVVHGPLTQVLMVEFLQWFLESVPRDASTLFVPSNIDYLNLQPLYVDQPMTLCCKPSAGFEHEAPAKITSWQVWIQTGTGENVSCAVKSTISINEIGKEEVYGKQ